VSTIRLRLTSACFALAGLLFVLYRLLRPFSDEKSVQGAAAVGSTAWGCGVIAWNLLVWRR
jgi:hypothetical protein